MHNAHQDFWDDKLTTLYQKSEYMKEPNSFAQEMGSYIPPESHILELGTGRGQDALYFAEQGHRVEATDFASSSLALFQEKIQQLNLGRKITCTRVDMTHTLPYEESSFDLVYSHLSLHYFSLELTRKILREIKRVLNPEGIIAVLANSVHDQECGMGRKIEAGYYDLGEGNQKRFFSVDEMRELMGEFFQEVLCDDQGKTMKDGVLGNTHLIRYVGKKE